MKVVLYEWCCSGGLHGPDAWQMPPAGDVGPAAVSTVMAEGAAMLAALLRDASRDARLDVTLLVDALAPQSLVDRLQACHATARIRRVAAGDDVAAVADAAAEADWTIVVAPETAGLLAARVAAVRRMGGRAAACGPRFLELAGDKQATATALAAVGVPVPAGRVLSAGEPLPAGFHLPAVSKARDGVGCAGLEIVRSPERVGPACGERRIEPFVPGIPVGVSCLCGPGGIVPLAPVRQRFSSGDRPRYAGGLVGEACAWRGRAEALAVAAIAAVMRRGGEGADAGGWVGVDMVLGDRDDGGGDRVLEVNPRLTTSFVGLATLEQRSLVRLLLDAAAGRAARPRPWPGRTVEFDAAGSVRVCDG